MNELTNKAMTQKLKEIETMESLDECLAYLKKLDGLEAALRSVEAFYDQSVKFARLHVAALIKAAELGGIKKLKGSQRKVAEWLSGLSDDEKDLYISMCDEGATIIYIYKKYVATPQKNADAFELLEQIKKNAVREVVETGIVDIESYKNQIREIVPTGIANDIHDGMRNDMRSAGAVGVGYDSGIYVMPCKDGYDQQYSKQAEYITRACHQRFESICRDLAKLRTIIRKSNISFSFQDCISLNDLGHYRYTVDQFRVLLMMSDAGMFKDSDYLEDWMNDSAQWKSVRNDGAPKTGREYYFWAAKDYTDFSS